VVLVVKITGKNEQSSPAKLGILRNEIEDIEVQLNQAVVNGCAIPVFWNPFPALVIGEVSRSSRDCEEAFDNFLGCMALVTTL
jgi:hypothetical protein